MRWIRPVVSTLALALAVLTGPLPALAKSYLLTPLVVAPFSPPNYSQPSINNLGHVAWFSFTPEAHAVLVVHDGTSASVVFDLTAAGYGFAVGTPVINDAGAITVPACGIRCLVRVNADRTATLLATFDLDPASGQFRELLQLHPSMNSAGQVAVVVMRHDGIRAVVRLDGPGTTEIAAETAELINFGAASINDSGRVAFTAHEAAAAGGCGCEVIHSGTGGELTFEGSQTIGGSGFVPLIRNDGRVLHTGISSPLLIFAAQAGVVTPLVVGDEDPVLALIQGQPTQNQVGAFAFVSRIQGAGPDHGLFTGPDPLRHTVARAGQVVFGTPLLSITPGLHYMNNAGQIVFTAIGDDVSDPSLGAVNYMLRADPVDHFLCYKAKPAAAFARRVVQLEDRFETGDFEVVKPIGLCTPAERTGEPLLDPDTHLESYAIKGPKHVARTGIEVTNQFGTITVDTVKTARLLVPTAKSLAPGPVTPPDPGSHDVDLFKCYAAKVTARTAKFAAVTGLLLDDQFVDDPGKAFDVKKPVQLCTPVDKNGEGIKRPDRHLLCYSAKPSRGEPKHMKRRDVAVNNQFDPEQTEQLDTVAEELLCVPSTVRLPG